MAKSAGAHDQELPSSIRFALNNFRFSFLRHFRNTLVCRTSDRTGWSFLRRALRSRYCLWNLRHATVSRGVIAVARVAGSQSKTCTMQDKNETRNEDRNILRNEASACSLLSSHGFRVSLRIPLLGLRLVGLLSMHTNLGKSAGPAEMRSKARRMCARLAKELPVSIAGKLSTSYADHPFARRQSCRETSNGASEAVEVHLN